MEGSKVIVIPKTILPNLDAASGKIRKKRVAAYCRVSSDMDDQLHSLETQKIEFSRKINENPEWEFVNLYTDEGITGTSKAKRKGFNDMIKDAMKGKIDLILVKSISRFARNTVDCLQTKRDLQAKGVEIFFEKENISSFNEASETMLTIYASFAQEESRQISTNVTWGVRARMRDGKYRIGATMLGFKKNENGELIVDEEGAKTVQLIFSLFLDGYSYREIIDELVRQGKTNAKGDVKWLVSNITSILGNEKYCGDIIYQKTFCKNYLTHERAVNNGELEQFFLPKHHEPIIDKANFMYVQLLRKKRKANYNPMENRNNMPLAGLVYCANCGRPMHRVQYNKGKKYERVALTCKMNIRNGSNYSNCEMRNTIDYDSLLKLVERIVMDEFKELDMSLISKSVGSAMAITESTDRINSLEEEINRHKTEINELVTKQIESGADINEYKEAYSLLQDKIKACESEIEAISTREYISSKKKEFSEDLNAFLQKNASLSPQIASKVIKRIYRLNDNSLLIIISKNELEKSLLENIREKIDDFRYLEPKEFEYGKTVIQYRILNLEDMKND